jgi:F-type H+-transporting ATPase subunit b
MLAAAMTTLVAAGLDNVATDVADALDEHKSGGLPQLNAPDFEPQLFWLAVTFVLLYWIMAKIALPRIGEVIEERRDRIQRDLAAAERLKGETDKALAAYEQALADARGSATAIARQTRDNLNAEVDKERKAVEDQLARKLADAEAAISATKTKALTSVKDIAADTAVAIVGTLTNVNVAKDEVDRALASASADK